MFQAVGKESFSSSLELLVSLCFCLFIYLIIYLCFHFQNTTVDDVHTATPFVTVDDVAGNTALFLAAVSGKQYSPVLRPVRLSPQADFIPRLVCVAFFSSQKAAVDCSPLNLLNPDGKQVRFASLKSADIFCSNNRKI